MVTVECHIDPASREEFLTALEALARERKRDGAYAWAFSKTSPTMGGFWKPSFSIHGWSTCASTSA